jgi:hypothetical protein
MGDAAENPTLRGERALRTCIAGNPSRTLSPGPGHRGKERSVRRYDARVRHVQCVWRRRPRLDAHSVVFHVIDDSTLAVGADGKLQFAGPAHDGIGARVTEAVIPRLDAGVVNLPLGTPVESLAHISPCSTSSSADFPVPARRRTNQGRQPTAAGATAWAIPWARATCARH